jgi:transposase
MARVEIFQGQARRRWSAEEKRRLVAETFAPGATVHGVARRHGVNTSQLFTWRKQFRVDLDPSAAAPMPPDFAAVMIAPAAPPPTASGMEAGASAPMEAGASAPCGLIEIELPQGGRVRISGAPDPATVTAALQVLVRR